MPWLNSAHTTCSVFCVNALFQKKTFRLHRTPALLRFTPSKTLYYLLRSPSHFDAGGQNLPSFETK